MMQQQGGYGGMVPPPQQQYPHQQQQQQQQPYGSMMMMVPPPQQQQQQPQPPQQQAPPMWAPHHLYQQQPQQGGGIQNQDEVRTLWIGDLQYWMDENYIASCFSHVPEVASIKIIRNKSNGQVEGYGFIEFTSHATAEMVLQTYNGTPMPNGGMNFRLNWASYGGGEKRDDTPEFTIFVGDLAADVTDYMLQETFRGRYPSVKGAKVVMDRMTGRTKGYGFVKFGDESEQLRAMTEMNGAYCSSRPMRIGLAASKKTVVTKASEQISQVQSEDDPNNTTIFVGNLDSNVTDDHLRGLFGQYGQLIHVKIPAGKRCGFVQFADRSCAEEALRMLNGAQVSGQSIRLSWGRSPSNKQPQQDASQWNGGYYGYGQGYENYGYAAAAPQDPNVYYGSYAGYGGYQQPQQQQQQPAGYN